MSTQILLTSTTLVVDKTNEKQFRLFVERIFEDYFDSSMLEENGSDEDGNLHFQFDYSAEVGDSFPDRVDSFAKASGKYLVKPVEFELREETMSDERDEYFYAGPDEDSTVDFKVMCHARRAKEALLPVVEVGGMPGTALHAAMKGLEAVMAIAGGQAEIDSRNVLIVTQFGELYSQGGPGTLVISSEHQGILVAGRMRDDGNADVLGSLNLDTLENLATPEAKALFENFVQAYSPYGVFQFVDAVPDLLTFRPNEDDSQSTDTPSTK